MWLPKCKSYSESIVCSLYLVKVGEEVRELEAKLKEYHDYPELRVFHPKRDNPVDTDHFDSDNKYNLQVWAYYLCLSSWGSSTRV